MEKIIKEYIETRCSIQSLSKKYKKDAMTISRAIKKAGFDVINRQNLVKIDEHVFDNIDTEEKAYWLGFLFADGCLNKRDNSFELSLAEKDKEHLEKFNIFIKHSRNIKIKKINLNGKIFNCYRCSFNSKHLCDTLKSYGCVPQKSNILKFPNIDLFNNKSLIKDFLRGYFDGDGCITHINKEHTRIAIKICGTIDFLNEYQKYLPLKKIYKIYKTHSVPELAFNDNTALNICKFLYNGCSIYLKRKYELYNSYCRLYEESYRLRQGKIGEDCDVNTEQTMDISQGSIAA